MSPIWKHLPYNFTYIQVSESISGSQMACGSVRDRGHGGHAMVGLPAPLPGAGGAYAPPLSSVMEPS